MSQKLPKIGKQAEAEVVSSSSLVEIEVEVEVQLGVEVKVEVGFEVEVQLKCSYIKLCYVSFLHMKLIVYLEKSSQKHFFC